jgi:hypothetical protein
MKGKASVNLAWGALGWKPGNLPVFTTKNWHWIIRVFLVQSKFGLFFSGNEYG